MENADSSLKGLTLVFVGFMETHWNTAHMVSTNSEHILLDMLHKLSCFKQQLLQFRFIFSVFME